MADAKRKIHKFNFKSEGAHVALVDKAANLQTVLTMKAVENEVVVSLSMRDFLEKFFNMWSDDATQLAKILGYTGDPTVEWEENDSYEDYINRKVESVQLLKGLIIPEQIPESIALKVESLQKSVGDKLTSEGSPHEAHNLEGDIKLSDVKIDKEELATLKAAALEVETLKSAAQEVETLKAQVAEVETLKSLVSELKSEKAAKAKLEMEALVKGYNFIPDADQEGVVEFLLKSEGNSVILKTLEKARDAIAESIAVEEAGVEAGEADLDEANTEKSETNDLVSSILAKRNS